MTPADRLNGGEGQGVICSARCKGCGRDCVKDGEKTGHQDGVTWDFGVEGQWEVCPGHPQPKDWSCFWLGLRRGGGHACGLGWTSAE